MKQILAGLRPLIPAENDAWVRARAAEALTNVTALRNLGVDEGPPIPISIDRGGNMIELLIPAGEPPRATIRKPWVRWTIEPEHNLAIFTLDACQINDQYRKSVRDFFSAVHNQKISRIAIDLRANTGGNSTVVDEFLRYYDIDEYRNYTSEVRWTDDAIAQRHMDGQAGYVNYVPTIQHNNRIEDIPAFTGETFVLTSKQTFSSGNWFAVIFQDNKLGQIVGEPTGNAPSSFGDTLSFLLPESGYAFFVSFKRWVRPDPSRDPAQCVTPDRIIPLTRAEIISGVDPVLDALRSDGKKERG